MDTKFETNKSTDTPPPSKPLSENEKVTTEGIHAVQGKADWNTGRPAELSALEQIRETQGQAIDLNSSAEGGHRSFNIYDVAGPNTVASVKHFGQNEGEKLSEQTLDQYRSAFRTALGRGTDPAKFEKAAYDLKELSRQGKSVPAELGNNPTTYLSNHAELWVPLDHVPQIQENLRSRLLSEDKLTRDVYASHFNLEYEISNYEEKVDKLLSRIKPLPQTSKQLDQQFKRGLEGHGS